LSDEVAALISRYDRAIERDTVSTVKEISAALDRAFRNLSADLTEWYSDNADIGSIRARLEVRRSQRLKQILTRINPNNGRDYEEMFESLLVQGNASGTDLATELLTARSNQDYESFGDIPFDALANQARDGARRLRNHTDDFISTAQAAVEEAIIRGQGARALTRQLKKSLGTTKSKAEMIARTELSSSYNGAAYARYERAGVKYFQWMAVPSHTLCPFCAGRNGNVYRIGVAKIPAHPRCRCYSLPYSPKWRKDGLIDDQWFVEYHKKRVAELGTFGLRPNYTDPTPFEKYDGKRKAPRPYWTPRGKRLAVKPKPKIDDPPPKITPTMSDDELIAALAEYDEDVARMQAIDDEVAATLARIEAQAIKGQQRAQRTRANDIKRAIAQKGKRAKTFKDFQRQGIAAFPDEYKIIADARYRIKDNTELLELVKAQTAAKTEELKRAYSIELAKRGLAKTELNKKLSADIEKQMRKIRKKMLGRISDEDIDVVFYQKRVSALIDDKTAQLLRRDFGEVYSLSNGKAVGVNEFLNLSDRAGANRYDNYVNIGALNRDYSKSTFYHELGHFIEYQLESPNDSRYFDAAQAWKVSKATSKRPRRLNQITNLPYDDDEVAYVGNYIDPYVGKEYDPDRPATEVISMGVERFVDAKQMSTFFQQDDEHFSLVLGILHD